MIFGDYLRNVRSWTLSRSVSDEFRATGLTGSVMSEGGFALKSEFVADVWQRATVAGQILSRCRTYEKTDAGRSCRVPVVSEASRAAGARYGGLAVTWEAEAGELDHSKIGFEVAGFNLKKVMAFLKASDELLEDSPLFGSVASDLAGKALAYAIEEQIVRGSGVGHPLGILNSPALITCTRTTSAKIEDADVRLMYDSAHDASKGRGVWIANGEASGELSDLENYDSSNGSETIFGRPILYSEFCSALGDVGDLIFVDFGEYGIFRRPLDFAQSMHVYFATAEQAFRFMIRIDGQPLWKSPIAPAFGSGTRSAFVALGNPET